MPFDEASWCLVRVHARAQIGGRDMIAHHIIIGGFFLTGLLDRCAGPSRMRDARAGRLLPSARAHPTQYGSTVARHSALMYYPMFPMRP